MSAFEAASLALWHALNLFAVPAMTGALAAIGAKLLWRRALAAVPLTRLLAWSVGACAGVAIAGLAVTGRDGRMATYAAMVAACAAALWWSGFRRR